MGLPVRCQQVHRCSGSKESTENSQAWSVFGFGRLSLDTRVWTLDGDDLN